MLRTGPLGPTTASLFDPTTRPYFLWWTDLTVADIRNKLACGDEVERAYWIGALMREANTRDIWLFLTPEQIKQAWPLVIRHLGRSRSMWAWLLELPVPVWPPSEAYHDR